MEVSRQSVSDGFTETMGNSSCPDKPMEEIMNTGFFIVDRDWMVIHWNAVAENLSARKAKDVVGFNLWEACGTTIPAKFYSVYHEVFLQVNPKQNVVLRWVEMGSWHDVVSCLSDDTLSVSFRSNLRTARAKDSRDRLMILNEVYRFVTEVTADCLWEWNISAREFFWLDGGHNRAFGYPIINAIVPQQFWESCIHPEDRPRILAGLENVISTRGATIWEDEYRFKRMDNTYCYVHDRAHVIYDKGLIASRMIGATQDITARRQAEIKLLESERTLGQERLSKQKELTEAVLAAQELERADIGKELHDNLNQILGATKMYIELAKTDDESRDFCLNKSSGLLVTVIEEIRKISKTLTIPEKHLMQIAESIHILLDDLAIFHPIKIAFTEQGVDEESLSDKIRLDIFRIVQEQLNNILKHAGATSATISLTQENSSLVLQIADNGKGCEIKQESEGIGMRNIRMRVDSHQGEFSVVSRPGEGFALRVKLPLNSPKPRAKDAIHH
jgi:signal transduction histidine kinase